MGGNLAVTIRTPDGKWHKMDRWTNPTPTLFTDGRFLAGDEKMIGDYLNTWYEMCAAYDDGTYEEHSPMASVYCNYDYASRDAMAPSEYGLVYIDFVDKKFWHMQGYSDYGTVSNIELTRSWRQHDAETLDWINSLLPRIKSWTKREWNKKTKQIRFTTTPVSFNKAEELIEHASSFEIMDSIDYDLDMSGWDYKSFVDDAAGKKEFLQLLRDAGIEFDSREESLWDSFRNYEDEE